MLLSRVVGRTHAPIGLDDLAPCCLSFLEVRFDLGVRVIFMASTRKEKRELISWVYWRVASHGGARISPSEHLGGDVIPSPSCVSWRFYSG